MKPANIIIVTRKPFSHIEAHMSLAKTIHSDAMYQKIQNLEISHKVEKSRKEAEIYRLRNIELLLKTSNIRNRKKPPCQRFA